MVAAPITQMINETVASYTKIPLLRQDIHFKIGLTENLYRVRQLLMELVKRDDDFMSEAQPRRQFLS